MLNRKNRLFENYKKHGYKNDDKVRLDAFRNECQLAMETAKHSYLMDLGNKLNVPNTSPKSYWKIINRRMNKCRVRVVPPLLVNNIFVLNCNEKAKHFIEFFSQQCTLVVNSSVLPPIHFLTTKRIDHIIVQHGEILPLIRNLNPNKAKGSDGISTHMLLLCDDSVLPPLKLIFQNILPTSTYPDMWKLANVTPIFKKGDKQLIKNHRPISLLPICGKCFKKIIFNNLYSYLNENNLGFVQVILQRIHYIFQMKSTRLLKKPHSLEVRAVFLDISKAFDKVWHEGLIFKLKRNSISGSLLNISENCHQNSKHRVVLNGSSSDY